jgi:tetratricopeptide (TPR) repeat protein
MPKAIKKRITKAGASEEEEVRAVLGRAREALSGREKKALSVLAAALAVIVIVVGLFYYSRSMGKEALKLEYQGYRQYSGLYAGASEDRASGAADALASFREAYGLKKSPYSLMYIANAHYELGSYADAAAALEELLGEYPGEAGYAALAGYKLGMARLKAGDEEAALLAFGRLYGTEAPGPYRDLALMEAARLLEGMGRTGEAMARYGTLTRDFPDSPFYEEALRKTGREDGKDNGG